MTKWTGIKLGAVKGPKVANITPTKILRSEKKRKQRERRRK